MATPYLSIRDAGKKKPNCFYLIVCLDGGLKKKKGEMQFLTLSSMLEIYGALNLRFFCFTDHSVHNAKQSDRDWDPRAVID